VPAASIYVYYRIAPDGQEEFARLARLHLAAVAARFEAGWRLMHSRVEPSTWMEVLEDVADADAAVDALRSSWEASGLGRFLTPGAARHVEIFEDTEPCA
jgi:hypothetical protein